MRQVVLLLIVIGCVLGVVASCRQRSRNQQAVNAPAEPAARLEQQEESEVTREAYIASHKKEYPQSLLELLERNPETVDFVYDYPKEGKKQHKIDLSGEVTQGTIPLFLQWDERWGYQEYGSDMLAITGCGPTCLSMVIFSLTRDETATPDALADYAMRHNYYVQGKGTLWSFLTDAGSKYSVQGTELSLDENTMKAELDEGHPIIASMRPGDFTTEGHFIVIYGYDEEGFLVHDPNSRLRSEEEWTFKTLYPQIKNLWAYSPE